MARRSRASAAAAAAAAVVEDVEPEDEEPQGIERSGLQFDEPLTWRAPRVIPVAELLRRLQALSKELGNMEQGEHDRNSFTKVAKELAFAGLLHHKDRGVKAWVACCLVDMLRLSAPDAPYTGAQLKDIFTLFVTIILPSLSDPSDAYNNQHLYVLQSLAQVKSVVLLTDIPSSDSLTLHLFSSFFDMMSGSSKSSTSEQIGKNVELHMTAILVILVDEATSLPVEVVDIIVAQFLRVDPHVVLPAKDKAKATPLDSRQSTLLLKELPPAYTMAKAICNSCPERMARNVSQYFNEVIMDASSNAASNGSSHKPHPHRRASAKDYDDSDDEQGGSGPTDDDLKELHKAHRLIRELWRASPSVLQSVVPQLEAELSTENVQLRLLATETLGDIVSGIGAAGPPPNPVMDPAVYPPATLSSDQSLTTSQNVLTIPSSPQPFPQTHPAAYASFLARRNDKSALIRSAWITGVGRILSTSAGGTGLAQSDEEMLLKDFATKLGDADERVRLAAVKAVACFSLRDIVTKLSSIGGVDKEGSLLANLAARARDRKHNVRVEGMRTLGRIWGVASGEIAKGTDEVKSALGSIPSKLFDTFYVNDLDINVLLDHVLFELLLPLSYPPIKAKPASKGGSQSNGNGDKDKDADKDADELRTERVLTLVKDLDAKSKKAFFAVQGRQVQLGKVMQTFLTKCEDFNGGVMDDDEATIKSHLGRLIDFFSKTLPDSLRVSADLWKFAEMHDRRAYQLVRFCMDPDSDYRTVHKAIKELFKRIESSPSSPAGLLETLTPLLYRVSLLVYNKSHIPPIVRLSQSTTSSLSVPAHELLLSISSTNPSVFKAHVTSLCAILTSHSPTATSPNDPGTVDTLKACAGFARRFPKEMPTDRKFLQSLADFAIYGTPPKAAKHAVTILLAAGDDRREMHAKDLLTKTLKDCSSTSPHFLARLATLAQLWLLAPHEVDESADTVVDIAIKDVLLKPPTDADKKKGATAKKDGEDEEDDWLDDDHLPVHLEAKLLALRLLTNRLLSHTEDSTRIATARPVLQLLTTLVSKSGELSKTAPTPASHRARLRLQAALLLLKLCTHTQYDALLSPAQFNSLAYMSQDGVFPVRHAFVQKLKKYLGQSKLPQRFYPPVFLLSYEPRVEFRDETVTWVRSRAAAFAREKHTTMESSFARLLSLLAHHPDFGPGDEDLLDFARYILFYLVPVTREENIGLILHIAQRVKQTVDAIDAKSSENLYYLSDLAQAIVRRYAAEKGWVLETWPGKVRLPGGLFAALGSSEVARGLAGKEYLSDGVRNKLEGLVRGAVRVAKRRRVEGEEGGRKKIRGGGGGAGGKTLPIRKPSTKKKRKDDYDEDDDEGGLPEGIPPSSIERRRSGRAAVAKTYAEESGSEVEDVEMEEAEAEAGADEEATSDAGEEDDADKEENSDDEAPPAKPPSRSRPTPASKTKSKSKSKANGKSKAKAKPTSTRTSTRGRTRGAVTAIDDDDDDDDEEQLSDPPSSD